MFQLRYTQQNIDIIRTVDLSNSKFAVYKTDTNVLYHLTFSLAYMK